MIVHQQQHTARGERTDLGLAILSCLVRPGEPLACEDIAAFCGCSWQYIWQIEQRALRKMRDRLQHRYGVTRDELSEHGFKSLRGQAGANRL
jgi:hypothetical protein